jgi:dTDP-4-dehydrorhamnose reductase
MDSLLITGGSGFLGANLALMVSSYWKTYATYHHSPFCNKNLGIALHLDIKNRDEVKRIVSEISPKIIIHTAAITNSDFCAEHREEAQEVNVKGTNNITLAAEHVGARLIYISTDLVFKGDKRFYSEEDIPNPLCYYGKTKLEGEKIVASLSSNYCIARTSLIYGWSINSSKCFTEIMIGNLNNGKEARLFVDEYRTPIYIKNLCEILSELAKREDLQGIYHLCSSQRLSRFEFGLTISEIFGFNKKLFIPVSVDNFSFKDKRPKDCSMKNEKSMRDLKTKIWSIEEGVKDMRSFGGVDLQ